MKLLTSGLSLACLASALFVVSASWECRQLAGRLMQAELRAQDLQTRWGQLLLEEAALGALPRIEQLAAEQYLMRTPGAANLVVVDR